MNRDLATTMADICNSDLANVRFRLSIHVHFIEQVHRGEIWVVMQNNANNKQFTTTPLVRDFIQQFKQTLTLAEAFKGFANSQQQTTAEWLELISKLIQADILSSPDLNCDDHRLQAHISQQRQLTRSQWSRPWMIKLALGNPDRLLGKLETATRSLWSGPVLVIWVLLLAVAVFQASTHFAALQNFWSTRFLDPHNLLLAALIYPALKFIHELGHGLAAKHWGAEVVETGILLIVFIPLPYIDVSQSSTFPKKYQRMLVAGAGMLFELTAAAVALLIWLATEDIVLQDICMNIMLIGAISSIFINANPLLKFDGYYLFSDFLEIPNLSTRAGQMIKYVCYNKLFHLPVSNIANSLAEARWLLGYGILSQVYRLSVSFYIALYLGSHYFFIGLALAVWLLITQILKPWVAALSALLRAAREHLLLPRTLAIVIATSGSLLVFSCTVPLQWHRALDGILMLDATARVQSHSSGFIDKILVVHGDRVEAGQPLFQLINSNTEAELIFLQNKIHELDTLDHLFRATDRNQADFYRDQAAAVRQEWQNLHRESESMLVLSPISGRFQKLSLNNLQGRYISKGEPLGEIMSPQNMTVLMVISEEEMKEIAQFSAAKVRLLGPGAQVYDIAKIDSIPAAINALPTAFLGSLHGGSLPVDSRDPEGIKLLRPMFQIALHLTEPVVTPVSGMRVKVKLTTGGLPLSTLLYRHLVQLLQERQIVD